MAGGSTETSSPLDSGLLAFVALLRFLGKPADPAQLKHQFAPDGEIFSPDHILRAAKRLDVKAKRERTSPERLEKAALPAIAEDTPKPGHRHGWLRRLVHLDQGDTPDGKDAQ